MTYAIDIKNVGKIFGSSWGRWKATKLIKQNPSIDKSMIMRKTGCVMGVKEMSLQAKKSEILVIMGESGSGKSTLLRLINRLIEPSYGSIDIFGENINQLSTRALRDMRSKRFAMIFQTYGLMPHWDVKTNVIFALRNKGISATEAKATAQTWIDKVGLSQFESKFPNQLSGGMRQRVGTARAFASNPDILLMDEPFSAVDPLVRLNLQDELLQLHNISKPTIVMVTHDIDEALRLGHRVAICKDGLIQQIGTAEEIVYHSKTPYVEAFVQNINRIRVIASGQVAEPIHYRLTPDDKVSKALSLADQHKLSTYAVVMSDHDKPLGLVNIHKLRQERPANSTSLQSLLEPIQTLQGQKPLADTLNLLKAEAKPIAILSHSGHCQGIIDRKVFVDAL